MKVIMMKWGDVVPYEKNPRINDDAVQYVANSIREFGFQQPIVVDRDNVIIVGHTRWKAAGRLKLKEVPVVIADNLTEEQVRAYRIADNSTGEVAGWDVDLLGEEMDLCPSYDFADFALNLEDTETEDIDPSDIVEDDVPEVDMESEPTAKRGQVWKLGRHRLMCGSATEENDVDTLRGGRR